MKEQQWYYLTHSWEVKEVHAFPKGIRLKVNVIVRTEFELAYYDFVVQRVSYYASGIPPCYINQTIIVLKNPLFSETETNSVDFRKVRKWNHAANLNHE